MCPATLEHRGCCINIIQLSLLCFMVVPLVGVLCCVVCFVLFCFRIEFHSALAETHYVEQATLEFRNPPTSAPASGVVLGLIA